MAGGLSLSAPAVSAWHSHTDTLLSSRRICPGRHVANSSLFINIASILWAANISREKDAEGNEIAPNVSDAATVNDGIVVRPLPFKCTITPRFPEVVEVVEQSQQGA
ncbi:hypothetical protein PM082_007980 [Marasmius tenuissimus]|nr:hypothetical protein PM082_007980 [Marasmius tenuissimus]